MDLWHRNGTGNQPYSLFSLAKKEKTAENVSIATTFRIGYSSNALDSTCKKACSMRFNHEGNPENHQRNKLTQPKITDLQPMGQL